MEAANPFADTLVSLWSLPKKIAFRYFFIFLGLETLLGFNMRYLGNRRAGWAWATLFGKPLYWFDKHFYHIGYNITDVSHYKYTDTPIIWVVNITFIWLAAIGCIAWSIADRRRLNYKKLDYWFRTYLAYYLFIMMVNYAVGKIVIAQMPFPNAASLLEPLGNKDRFDLLWCFIGASPEYSVFTGICEMLAALLVLSRRTRVFGCLIMATIMANIVCFNIFYNIIVKLLSIQLLVINIYILIPYLPKLIAFFYYHKAVSLNEKRYSFAAPWKNCLILAILAIPALTTYNSARFFINLRKKDVARQQQKVYDVTCFVKNNDTLLPLLTDTFRAKRLIFTAYRGEKYAAIYGMKDEFNGYYYSWDSTHKCITLINSNDSTKRSLLYYTELPKKQLLLTGRWKGQSITILLDRFEVDSMPLVKEKIKWVQYN